MPGVNTTCTLRVADPQGRTTERVLTRLEAQGVTLGRSSSVEVVLDDAEVSRRHAVLEPAGGGEHEWIVRDLNSRNGTLVNGVPITRHALRPGDVIELGGHRVWLIPPTEGSGEAVEGCHPTVAPESVIADRTAAFSRLMEMGRPRIDAVHLRAVQQFGRELLALSDEAARTRRLCDLMVSRTWQGTYAAVLRMPPIPDGEGGRTWRMPVMVCGPISADEARHPSGDGRFVISRGLVQAAMDSGEAVLATAQGGSAGPMQDSDPEVVSLTVAPEPESAAVIAVPLPTPGGEMRRADGAVDLLYVMLPGQCGTGEWLALTALAVEQYDLVERSWAGRHAAEARARIEQDLARAREVQLGLVPVSPHIEGLELALHFEPCLSVGGDYLDVLTLPDGRALLTVMDVCGKGMPAALISSSLHTFFHSMAAVTSDLPRIMAALNRYLCGALPDHAFVTAIALALDPATGEVEFINAGHPPVIVAPGPGSAPGSWSAPGSGSGGEARFFRCGDNVPLGMLEEEPIACRDRLQPGEVAVLYTDGLTELIDDTGQWIGHEGLAVHVQRLAGGGTSGLLVLRDRLLDTLHDIAAGRPAEDDVTFLLARRANSNVDGSSVSA